MLRLQIVLNK